MNLNEINPLVLAYLGDSVYETYIRLYLVKQNIPTIGKLQHTSLFMLLQKVKLIFLID